MGDSTYYIPVVIKVRVTPSAGDSADPHAAKIKKLIKASKLFAYYETEQGTEVRASFLSPGMPIKEE